MSLNPVQLRTGLLSPFPKVWSPEYFLCTGAILGDGVPRFASVFTTFCETHVKKAQSFTPISPEYQPSTFVIIRSLVTSH